MNQQIAFQTQLALSQRGLTFVGFDVVSPGPRRRFVAKAIKRNVRVEAMGHSIGDAEDKLVRLVRAN